LTVAQTIPEAEALIVTTPQEISLADVRKSISFCRQVNMNIIGLVENMSGFACPHCGEKIDLFKAKGGQMIAAQENLRLLASLPIEPEVVSHGDQGTLIALEKEQGPYTREFHKILEVLEETTPHEVRSPNMNQGVEGKIDMEKEINDMEKLIFAVPTSGGRLCAHFGHCDQFALVETENGEIKKTDMHTPPPHEPGVLPKWLHEQGAHVIIAGGMGARAQDLFSQNNIQVVTGAPVDTPESLVNQYIAHSLETGENLCDH
jgi:predicted Fe-Mo cluster-binding NifX family protein/DNA-directed RNA polymerase subunit RPC12/RpoP